MHWSTGIIIDIVHFKLLNALKKDKRLFYSVFTDNCTIYISKVKYLHRNLINQLWFQTTSSYYKISKYYLTLFCRVLYIHSHATKVTSVWSNIRKMLNFRGNNCHAFWLTVNCFSILNCIFLFLNTPIFMHHQYPWPCLKYAWNNHKD